jgi:type VI protein secretion system component VasF
MAGSIDIQWALENLATKDDIERVERSVLQQTEGRLKALEDFKAEHIAERREHLRRHDDRRRQRVTWAIGLVGPLVAVLALMWNGFRTVLEAMRLVGPR